MTIVTRHQRLEDIRHQPLKIIKHQTLYTRDQQTLKTSDQQILVTIHQTLVDTKHLPLDTKDKSKFQTLKICRLQTRQTIETLHFTRNHIQTKDNKHCRNQKLESRIQKLETRNQKLETRNQKLETKNQKLERKRQVNRGFLHFIYFFLTLYSINKCICVIMKEIHQII